jgi:hypothetical protein
MGRKRNVVTLREFVGSAACYAVSTVCYRPQADVKFNGQRRYLVEVTDQMDNRFRQVEKRARRVLVLAMASTLIVLMGVNHLINSQPSALQACIQTCAVYHRQGELVYKFTKQQISGDRYGGPGECQCR